MRRSETLLFVLETTSDKDIAARVLGTIANQSGDSQLAERVELFKTEHTQKNKNILLTETASLYLELGMVSMMKKTEDINAFLEYEQALDQVDLQK